MTTSAASMPRTLIDVLPSPTHEVGRMARDGVLVTGFAVLTRSPPRSRSTWG